MRKRWYILRNLWLIWANRDTLRAANESTESYKLKEASDLDFMKDDEVQGVMVLSQLYKVLTEKPSNNKTDFKKIKRLYDDAVKNN